MSAAPLFPAWKPSRSSIFWSASAILPSPAPVLNPDLDPH
jgi:hypothetical protein